MPISFSCLTIKDLSLNIPDWHTAFMCLKSKTMTKWNKFIYTKYSKKKKKMIYWHLPQFSLRKNKPKSKLTNDIISVMVI